MHRIPVGVLGASGYAGRELCALVAGHPQFELVFATANERRGDRLVLPSGDITFVATDDAPLQKSELVFSSLPHGASAEWVARARSAGARVVDLSSDLRPGHAREDVPYGLTELHRDDLKDAPLIANPGCYPTAILLGLAPVIQQELTVPGALIVADAASGVTGAGNSPRADMLFGEVSENFRAYSVGNEHRHLPEMRATISRLCGDVDLLFTPHLLPVARGILATITVPVTAIPDDLLEPWRRAYADEPFIELSNDLPSIKDVVRRNVVRIAVRRVSGVRQPTLLVFAAIDNLVKGAAGQAVQNANVSFRFPEPMGLPA
ncbi:MAG TPA: N-acetyl-gamma-glutamyl-phosphate reductase [Gemmatimonadaceae bacterium]|nr:N-acetyl-gamma-glutamyl-phosphate reductase [Gemmatimonadaceae bacterium]